MPHKTLEREACQVQIRLRRDGESVGSGFLCIPNHVLTCGHVVAQCAPGERVFIAFPFATDTPVIAAELVEQSDDAVDVAVLRLCGDPPLGVRPPKLLTASSRLFFRKFQVYGFPQTHPDGIWASGDIVARPIRGRLQLKGDFGPSVQPGFSGAPVWKTPGAGVVAMVQDYDGSNPGTAYGITIKEICRVWPELRAWIRPKPLPRTRRWLGNHHIFAMGLAAVAAAVFVAVGWWVNDVLPERSPPPAASPSVPVESAPAVLLLGARTPRGEPDWPAEVWARPGERIEFNAFYSGRRANATDQARLTVRMSEELRHVPGSTVRSPDDNAEAEPLYDSLLFERWVTPDPLFPLAFVDDPVEEGVVRFTLQVVAEPFCIPRELAVTLQAQAPRRESMAVVHVACDPTAKSPDVLLETAVRNASLGDTEWLGRVRPNVDQVVEGRVFFMNRTAEVLRDARLRLILPSHPGVEFQQALNAEFTWSGGASKSAVPATIILPGAQSTLVRAGRWELRKGEHPLATFDHDLDVVPLGDLQPGEAGYVNLRVTVLGDG